MIFLSILIFILAMSLRSFKTQISPIFYTRIAALAFIYSGVLTFNALHIQSIGSGIGIYSGLFQVTYYSLFFETFLYAIGAIILLSWPLFYKLASFYSLNIDAKPSIIKREAADTLTFPFFNGEGLSSVKAKPGNLLTSLSKSEGEGEVYLPLDLSLDGKPKTLSKTKILNYKANSLNIKEYFSFLNNTYNSVNGVGGALEFISSVTTSKESREYSLIALFSCLGGSLLLSSGDLLSMYLSIELQSFGLYILATIYRESGSATSAGLKYFLLGCLSSCLILLGIALVYSFTGLTSFESLYSLISVLSINKGSVVELSSLVTEINPLSLVNLGQTSDTISFFSSSENISQGITLGLILIVVGFLFKIAGAPFHNWSPDVYDESPTNVTIWLTIMPKLSIVLLLLELEMGISLNISQPLIVESSSTISNIFDSYLQVNLISGQSNVLKNIFLLSSLLSLIIGTVVGLAQIRIKRLLAYSTVSHVGFLLLALAISSEQSTESLIFYLIQYTITNLNAFFILLAFGYIINSLISSSYINSEIKFIFNLKGQFLSNPILSLSLAVCLFSMAGIPPLIGFFGKQSVLLAAIGSGYFFMAFVAIVVSVISASYYLRIIRDLHSHKNTPEKGSLIVSDDGVKSMSSHPALFSIESKVISLADLSESSAQISNLTHSEDNRLNLLEDIEKHLTIKNDNILSNRIERLLLKIDGISPHFKVFVSSANNTYLNLTNTHAFIIASLTLSIIFYVLKPSILLNSAVLSTLSLFYF